MTNAFIRQTHFAGLLLPRELAEMIDDCRKWMAANYGCKSGHKTEPHITLVPPFALSDNFCDKDVQRAFQEFFCANESLFPLSVHVQGFGCFSERTLYVNVIQNQELEKLHSALLETFRRIMPCAVKKSGGHFTPHITVSNRDIPQGAMSFALSYFAALDIDTTFTADSLALFKRAKSGGWLIQDIFSVQ